MVKIRKKCSAEFKLKVVLEVLKGEKTARELAGVFLKSILWFLGDGRSISKPLQLRFLKKIIRMSLGFFLIFFIVWTIS